MKRKVKLFFLVFLLMGLTLMNIPTTKASPAYEDFSDYDEYDPNDRFIVYENNITIDNLVRDENGMVNKDFTIEGDFFHNITVNCTNFGLGDNAKFSCWAITTVNVTSEHEIDLGIGNGLNLWCGYNPLRFQLRNWLAGSIESECDIIGSYSYGVEYYITINRTDTIVAVYIYNSTHLVGNNSLIQIEARTYNYLYGILSSEYYGSAWISGYVKNLYLSISLSVTFYYNYGGIFRVDNVTIVNGSSKNYSFNTIIELASLPKNESYVFKNFTWDNSNSTTNPYDLTIPSHLTVWCYFSLVEVETMESYFLAFGFIMATVAAAIFIMRRKKPEDVATL